MRQTALVIGFILVAGTALAQGSWQAAESGCDVWRMEGDARPGETVTWSGGCFLGRASGEGVLVWSYPADGETVSTRYEGSMWRGRMHGDGRFEWPGGDVYEGGFRNGLQHGEGVKVWANGDRYEGRFRFGSPDGRGVYVWATGERYEGRFRDGEPVDQ